MKDRDRHQDQGETRATVPDAEGANRRGTPRSSPGPGSPLHPGSPGAPDTDLTSGYFAGEYEVTGFIGRGGMSVVYEGVHPLIGKRVAIKVLKAKHAESPELIARFLQEAQLVNKIQSEHIVNIFALGHLSDGRLYLVMDLLEGQALHQLIRDQGRLPVHVALPIFRCVAQGIHAVHQAKVVHRDVKPQNIMVRIDPETKKVSAKVLDFGVSKLLVPEEEPLIQTLTYAAIGTPPYMSPEQVRGPAVDHRSDIYSFGITLYEALTGSVPFDGKTFIDVANQHLLARPPAPRELAPDVPPSLEALILHCLEKDPARRPQSMLEVLQVLNAVNVDPSLAAPELPAVPRRQRRSTRRWLWGLAVLGGLASGVAAHLLFSARPPSPQATGSDGQATALRPDLRGLVTRDGRSDQRITPVSSPGDARATASSSEGSPGPMSEENRPPLQPRPKGSIPPPKPGRPLATKLPSPEVAKDLRAVQEAIDRRDFALAIRRGMQSLQKQETAEAYVLLGMAYCGTGDLGMARAMLRRLPKKDHRAVRRYCERLGLTL
jgi:serine/threonine-protein kinase